MDSDLDLEDCNDDLLVQPHPLLLYPIIKNLSRYASFHDLKTMRQVCHQWKIETANSLAQKSKVCINGKKKLKKFLLENPQSPPCFTYELKNLKIVPVLRLILKFGSTIQFLSLNKCEFNSTELRYILYKKLPSLISLKLIIKSSSIQSNDHHPHRRVLPMSFGRAQIPLLNLRELELIGDFSFKTDILYEILKSANNLQVLKAQKKYSLIEDDLFGTWLTEICLAFEMKNLICLELESPLLESQMDILATSGTFSNKLKRLSLNFVSVPMDKICCLLENFPFLESVELGFENVPNDFIECLLRRFKNASFWIAVHSKFDTKLIFPAHSYVLRHY